MLKLLSVSLNLHAQICKQLNSLALVTHSSQPWALFGLEQLSIKQCRNASLTIVTSKTLSLTFFPSQLNKTKKLHNLCWNGQIQLEIDDSCSFVLISFENNLKPIRPPSWNYNFNFPPPPFKHLAMKIFQRNYGKTHFERRCGRNRTA